MRERRPAPRAFSRFWFCVVLCSSPAAGTERPALLVHVHDGARLEPSTLHIAAGVVCRLFERAGIRVIVVGDGAASTREGAGSAAVPRIHASVASRRQGAAIGLPTNVLGVAPGEETDPCRAWVYVFDHVAERLAEGHADVGKAIILGHAIAHEIGHVLLHSGRHSESGLMKAEWQPEDVAAMPGDRLTFDGEQIAAIRAEVLRRTARQGCAGS